MGLDDQRAREGGTEQVWEIVGVAQTEVLIELRIDFMSQTRFDDTVVSVTYSLTLSPLAVLPPLPLPLTLARSPPHPHPPPLRCLPTPDDLACP